ncbi:MAG: PDZ domain-containing protein [Oligoflexia bacterium]|nr:PDZ domain-containing protein [Oligoflexia bacterium]
MSTFRSTSTALVVILAIGSASAAGREDPVTVSPKAPGVAQMRTMSDAFASVAAAVTPATVYIDAQKGPPVAAGLAELMRDYRLPSPDSDGQKVESSGSGVIISKDGLVLTNYHVIAGASSPVVTLYDRRSFPAELVGGDARTDIAVLRILGKGPFPWAELGDSDAVRVGQWVMTVGHPFDFQFTVTTGIISARGRRNLFHDEIQDYLQTDAAMNPGSSGGPLFDLSGRVIGINTAIYTVPGTSSQNTGISFAIPSSMAHRVADELLNTGRVARASLGLNTRDRPFSVDHPNPGAEITRVAPGSPAAAAGLLPGDVILTVDGERVIGSDDLRALVLARGVHVDLDIGWQRQAQPHHAVVRTGDEQDLESTDLPVPDDAVEWAGLTVVIAAPADLATFNHEDPSSPAGGLLVLSVAPDSSAAIAGLMPGDLLVEAGISDLHTPQDLIEAAGQRRSLTLHFFRADGENWAALGGLR